ncbi:hypothetical protein ACH5RR_034174 [Cinchona calisaya]|uniref:Uncharacterized protein n=1 Tax=Cinchona calisaya TaxID=153742 RepID=A0ABD2YFK5_9GENT
MKKQNSIRSNAVLTSARTHTSAHIYYTHSLSTKTQHFLSLKGTYNQASIENRRDTSLSLSSSSLSRRTRSEILSGAITGEKKQLMQKQTKDCYFNRENRKLRCSEQELVGYFWY